MMMTIPWWCALAILASPVGILLLGFAWYAWIRRKLARQANAPTGTGDAGEEA